MQWPWQKQLDRLERKLDQLRGDASKLVDYYRILNERTRIMAATLDDVLKDVEAETTLIGGIGDLIAGLKQQIADALSGANLPPAVQAKIDQAFVGLEANKQKLADALAANTP